MQSNQPSVFARDDTLLGVCEALGEDFGFNPFYLRVTLGVLMIWFPVAVLAAYAIAGSIVALSRLLFPRPRAALARQQADAGGAVIGQPAAEHMPLKREEEVGTDMLAAAA